LKIEKKKKYFELNEEHYPIGYHFEARKDAHFMVEEFMLLANMLVAEKLVKTY